MIGERMRACFAMATVIAMVLVSLLPLASAGTGMANITLLQADVDIDNSYAVTEITATFENQNDQAIQDTMVFRLPEDAFITNFSLTVEGVTYYAKIMKKEKAEEKFERAKDSGNNAGLLSSRGKNEFSYDLSISARDSVTVTIRYEDFIERTVDGYRYELDLISFEARRIGRLDIRVDLDYDRTITDLKADTETYTDGASVTMENGGKSGLVTYQADHFMTLGDFVVTWDLEGLPVNGRMLFYETGGGEGYFLHVFNPGASELGGYIPKDIVFVLDRSGSMSGRKIAQLKDAFQEVVGELRPVDRFQIITFSSDYDQLYDGMKKASDKNKASAVDEIGGVEAGGGTNINDAVLKALRTLDSVQDRVPIVVLLTDGLGQNPPDETRKNVREQNKVGATIFCLGLGDDVDFEFLKGMALENGGHAVRIYEADDASDQITDFYETISLPLLRNADFHYSNGTYDVLPTHVNNMFEGEDIVIVGRYEKGVEHISFGAMAMTSTGDREFLGIFTVDATDDTAFIRRYWAYAMIQDHLDQIAVKGEEEELVDTVIRMSLEFGFVTCYTSLFVEVPIIKQGSSKITSERPSFASGRSRAKSPSAADNAAAPGFDAVVLVPAIALVAIYLAWRNGKRRSKKK